MQEPHDHLLYLAFVGPPGSGDCQLDLVRGVFRYRDLLLFCKEKDIPLRILERFSFGLNHADIGSLMAMKWNFPDALVQGIKFHHDPLTAPVLVKNIVFCVYLANAFCDLERGFITWEQVEKPVLTDFGITSEEQGRKLLASMARSFEEQSKKKD